MDALPVPFGRLLIDPHCTRDAIYIPSIMKALICLCREQACERHIMALKALRERVQRSRKNYTVEPQLFERLAAILSEECKHEGFFAEAFLLLAALLLANAELDWKQTFWQGFVRLTLDTGNVLQLDSLMSRYNLDMYRWLVGCSKEHQPTCEFFNCLGKVLASRFDDDYSGAWELCLDLDRHWLPKKSARDDHQVFLQFTYFMSMLCRVSFSDAALDMVLKLCDKLFISGFDFHDPEHELCSSVSGLVKLTMASESESNRNWMISSLTSNIRRLVPSSRMSIDIASTSADRIFTNLSKFALPFVDNPPVLQAFLAFVRQFTAPTGICKNTALAQEYITLSLGPLGQANLPGLCGELSVDVLAHCEGAGMLVGVDGEYLSLLEFLLHGLSMVDIGPFSMPIITQGNTNVILFH